MPLEFKVRSRVQHLIPFCLADCEEMTAIMRVEEAIDWGCVRVATRRIDSIVANTLEPHVGAVDTHIIALN